MNFNNYKYIPTLRTRNSELLGVRELNPQTKGKILPVASLSRVNRNSSVSNSLEKWLIAFDKPAIIELAHSPHLQVDEYSQLIDPEGEFRNWLNFIGKARIENAGLIPALMYGKDVGKRDFVRQLIRFESEFGKVVLRINPLKKRDVAAASTAASVVGRTENILFILDCGQIMREHQKVALDATIRALNELRVIEPSIDVVTAGTSFPRMFSGYCVDAKQSHGVIPMLEWENYHALGGPGFAIYGDYGGIHGEFYKGSYAKFVARVDYPTPGVWIFERRRQLNEGQAREALYADAANTIIASENWDSDLDIWGTKIIQEASRERLEKFGTPAKWISVRLNIHIERTLQFLEQGITFPESPIDKDDWGDEDGFEW